MQGEPSTQPVRNDRLVQMHIWLRQTDLDLLRELAVEREQTLSAVIRSLLKAYRRSRNEMRSKRV